MKEPKLILLTNHYGSILDKINLLNWQCTKKEMLFNITHLGTDETCLMIRLLSITDHFSSKYIESFVLSSSKGLSAR